MQRAVQKRFLHAPTQASSLTSTSKVQLASRRQTPPCCSPRRYVSTVNQDEVNHFSSLAATWWDETGSFKHLQRMNKVRVQFLRERLLEQDLYEPASSQKGKESLEGPQFLKGKKVLDVGCGGGLFAERLARLGATTLAIDASSENISAAKVHASQDPLLSKLMAAGELEYRNCPAEDLLAGTETEPSSFDNSFDIVCAMEVLEHVSDPQGFLKCLAALTKPGGQVVLSTIARTPLAKVVTIDLAESPIFNYAPAGSHTYTKFIKPSEIDNFFIHELGWPRQQPLSASANVDDHLTPDQRSLRYNMETRGTTYLPWNGEWTLLGKDDPERGLVGELEKSVNYFWSAKKPVV